MDYRLWKAVLDLDFELDADRAVVTMPCREVSAVLRRFLRKLKPNEEASTKSSGDSSNEFSESMGSKPREGFIKAHEEELIRCANDHMDAHNPSCDSGQLERKRVNCESDISESSVDSQCSRDRRDPELCAVDSRGAGGVVRSSENECRENGSGFPKDSQAQRSLVRFP
ncbi:hypothetical protein BDV98DRAFT_608235 [Pterulicium gracile]|uniref:Uncharacterized protein n=1 Tax=Pterulicium gracile TaxID=1884261 RepID=A0A5C3Q4M6_9AGAR|nr:hypothetical protein BDV98DRAFT_608235 [Pterula gracilis]